MTLDQEIESLINSAAEASSKNRLSVIQVRQWLSEYLEMYSEELMRFPKLIGKPHADVLVADFDKRWPELFVFASFAGDAVTIGAGRGEAAKIDEFLQRDFPSDTSLLIGELDSRFSLSELRLTITREQLTCWLAS